MIEERQEFLREKKLKEENAKSKENSLKVIKSKPISKDPPKPFNQTGILFKKDKKGDAKPKFLRRETYPDNAKEMREMSAE
jgi:hypothetical protein